MTFRTETIAEGVTLILGDCREVLPTLPKVDAVVTSPPYNLVREGSGGYSTTLQSHERRYEEWYEDELPEDEYQSQQKVIITQLLERCNGSVFYNHKVRYALFAHFLSSWRGGVSRLRHSPIPSSSIRTVAQAPQA